LHPLRPLHLHTLLALLGTALVLGLLSSCDPPVSAPPGDDDDSTPGDDDDATGDDDDSAPGDDDDATDDDDDSAPGDDDDDAADDDDDDDSAPGDDDDATGDDDDSAPLGLPTGASDCGVDDDCISGVCWDFSTYDPWCGGTMCTDTCLTDSDCQQLFTTLGAPEPLDSSCGLDGRCSPLGTGLGAFWCQ